jgi:uncharacterized integral membrane protein
MVTNLYLILVVTARLLGLYMCVNACLAAVSRSFMWSFGQSRMQGPFLLVVVGSFVMGVVLFVLSKPIARMLTKDLD